MNVGLKSLIVALLASFGFAGIALGQAAESPDGLV